MVCRGMARARGGFRGRLVRLARWPRGRVLLILISFWTFCVDVYDEMGHTYLPDRWASRADLHITSVS